MKEGSEEVLVTRVTTVAGLHHSSRAGAQSSSQIFVGVRLWLGPAACSLLAFRVLYTFLLPLLSFVRGTEAGIGSPLALGPRRDLA